MNLTRSCSGDTLDAQIWTTYMKAFKSYRLTYIKTDRQMLSKLYVYNAASRVVNKLEQTSNCQDKCSHYMQSRYTFYICPTYPVYCNLFSSMHHEFFIFVIYIRHRSLIHLLWQKSFLHDSLHDVLHCRARYQCFLRTICGFTNDAALSCKCA